MATIWRMTTHGIQRVEGIRRTDCYVWVRFVEGGDIFKCKINCKGEGYYFTHTDAVEALKQLYVSQYADLSDKLDKISQSAKFLGLNLPRPMPFSARVMTEPSSEAARRLVEAYNTTPGSSGPYCCPQALAAALRAIREGEDLDTLANQLDVRGGK